MHVKLLLLKYKWLFVGYLTVEVIASALTYKHYLPQVTELMYHYLGLVR